jgi:hypothetical protein
VSNRTHNHGGYTLVQGGEKKKTRIQPAGRRVSREDTASWSALLSIIKAVKFIKKQGPNSVKTVNLYTSAIGAVQRLCNTSVKPAGRGLALAFTAALEDLFDLFPHIKVNVIGVNKSQLSRPCDHMHWDSCFKCHYAALVVGTSRTRFFGGKISFPESDTHDLKRKRVTNSLVLRWQEGFEDEEDRNCYKGHGWLELWNNRGNDRKKIVPTHINFGPWLRSYNGVTIANDPRLCGRFVRAVTKHAPIGEYRQRFFPAEDYCCPGHENTPESRDHILNECSWYVRRLDHYEGGIETITGLILFLCDNPDAFGWDSMEVPRNRKKDWPMYRKEVYGQRDRDNEIRRRKGLKEDKGPIFLHETVGYYYLLQKQAFDRLVDENMDDRLSQS